MGWNPQDFPWERILEWKTPVLICRVHKIDPEGLPNKCTHTQARNSGGRLRNKIPLAWAERNQWTMAMALKLDSYPAVRPPGSLRVQRPLPPLLLNQSPLGTTTSTTAGIQAGMKKCLTHGWAAQSVAWCRMWLDSMFCEHQLALERWVEKSIFTPRVTAFPLLLFLKIKRQLKMLDCTMGSPQK